MSQLLLNSLTYPIMLGKIFGGDKPQEPAETPRPRKEPKAPVDRAPWEARLAEAQGDDAALLKFAIETPLIDLKVAAIEGIAGEVALKEAELAFREHHRRAHREAKHRLERLQWTRKTRERAQLVIADAEALRALGEIPANRLVELDRAWAALDQGVLEAAQTEAYDGHWQALSKGMRARGDLLVQTTRWAAAVQAVMGNVRRIAREVATGSTALEALDVPREQLAQCMADAPSGDAALEDADLHAGAMALLAGVAALAARVQYLQQHGAEGASAPDEAEWLALPETGDAALARILQERFADLLRESKLRGEAERALRDETARADKKALDSARRAKLGGLIAEAEARLAEGQSQEALAILRKIDGMVSNAPPDRKLQGRVQHLHSEVGQLNKWKQWGGGRVREDLVTEAEALAVAAAQPKLSIKAHGEAIEKLRERWREVDKVGGASSKELWLKFDQSLKTAFLPVQAELDRQRTARAENLAARRALIDALDTAALPDPHGEVSAFRALARTLDHFQVEWRKLGPVEYTVPRKEKAALEARMKASMARLEEPLAEVRRVEQLKREKIIAQAKAIDAKSREAIDKVKAAQAEWQAHAKLLPLAREVENALWRDFKAATDAVFTSRDEAFKARANEFTANRSAREALITRLAELGPDTPTPAIRATLGEVEQAWRKAGEPARADAAKLEQRYRHARDSARRLLEGSATREWARVCDAVLAALGQAGDSAAAFEAKPGATLPASWAAALAKRDNGAAKFDRSVLLQLEDVLDIPSPPTLQAERRALKLLAMKRAMEARQGGSVGDKEIGALVAQMIAGVAMDSEDGRRAVKIIEKLKSRPLQAH